MVQYIDNNNINLVVQAKKVISDVIVFYIAISIYLVCFIASLTSIVVCLMQNKNNLPFIFMSTLFFLGICICFKDFKKYLFKKNIYLTKDNLIITQGKTIIRTIPKTLIKNIKSRYSFGRLCGHYYEVLYSNKAEEIHFFNLNEIAQHLNVAEFTKHKPFSILVILVYLWLFGSFALGIFSYCLK